MTTKVIIFKVTSEQKQAIQKEADRLGLSMSAFIRLLIQQWSDGIRFERRENRKEE